MEKAYDPKDLALRLKAQGLEIAEDGVKILINQTFAWFADSAKLSSTPWDDMAMIVLPRLKDLALAEADKIDGKVG